MIGRYCWWQPEIRRSPVEGKVVYPHCFFRVWHHPKWLFRISEASTVSLAHISWPHWLILPSLVLVKKIGGWHVWLVGRCDQKITSQLKSLRVRPFQPISWKTYWTIHDANHVMFHDWRITYPHVFGRCPLNFHPWDPHGMFPIQIPPHLPFSETACSRLIVIFLRRYENRDRKTAGFFWGVFLGSLVSQCIFRACKLA